MQTNTKPQADRTETEVPKLAPLILKAITATEDWKQFECIALPRETEKLIELIRQSMREDRNQISFNITRLKQDVIFKLSATTVTKGRQRISYKPAKCLLLHTLFNTDNFVYLKETGKILGDERKWKPAKFLLEAIEAAVQNQP